MDVVKAANKIKIDTVIKNLEKRNMMGHYCETTEDACAKVLSMVQDNSIVSWGGSVTIDAIGVKAKLAERNLKIIDPYATKDFAENIERRRQSLLSDYFIMSTNSITIDGELINIDGTSNRVAALCFGPKQVILVVGANKIVSGVEDALTRVKIKAAMPNALRLGKNTPCTQNGICNNCLSKDCICCNIVMTRFCAIPGRIQVILVNECLGF